MRFDVVRGSAPTGVLDVPPFPRQPVTPRLFMLPLFALPLFSLAGCGACEVVLLNGPVQLAGTCGDGSVDNGEECDDGPTGNTGAAGGCDVDCSRVRSCLPGFAFDEAAAACVAAPPASCGNGATDVGEECDDGALANSGAIGGCSVDCTWVRACVPGFGWDEDALRCVALPPPITCGDAVVDAGEECDDGTAGNTGAVGACAPNCARVRTCAPGAVWSEDAMACVVPGAVCGDGALQDGEACDDGVAGNTGTPGACGSDCVRVPANACHNATVIDAGNSSACAVVDGAAWCWGRTGDVLADASAAPQRIPGLENGVTAVAVGDGHACAIQNGAAKCWGRNGVGELGDGAPGASHAEPVQVVGLESGVTDIDAGYSHTCAVHNGAVVCWGYGDYGMLGNGDTQSASTPVQVVGLTAGVTQVSAGGNGHACALVNGSMQCWGSTCGSAPPGCDPNSGELGNGARFGTDAPVQVEGLTAGVAFIEAGIASSLAVKDNALWVWGNNFAGNLGIGTSLTDYSVPQLLPGDTSGVSMVSAGGHHACFVQAGALFCMGHNGTGELGDGTRTDRTSPVAVVGLSRDVVAVAAGGTTGFTCALVAGLVRCWGDNGYGQLGGGTVASSSEEPVVVICAEVPPA